MCSNPNLIYRNYKNSEDWHFRVFNADFVNDLRKKNCEYYLVPCGSCFECILDYRRNWAVRLLHELETSKNAIFLTLTYNDKNLPNKNSLKKEHLQRFFKSLKQHYNCKDLKYYAVGEYGSKGGRPHYHAIVFNIPINDSTDLFPLGKDYINKYSKSGEKLFYSATLEKLWHRGFTDFGNVTFNSCSYVAGYIQKKLFDNKFDYLKKGIECPFSICSKGIGKEYFLEHMEKIVLTNEVFYVRDNKVFKTSCPRYYNKLLEKINPFILEKIRFSRLKGIDNTKSLIASMSYLKQIDFFKNKGDFTNLKKIHFRDM